MMRITMQDIADYAAQRDMNEHAVLRLVAEEAFLRRAAIVDGPFMLKGSYVTSQQIDQAWRRMPGDLDWVGLGALDANELTAWATAVTETDCDDGIRFDSFSKNAFWRDIDYAMDDDFPTVNTSLDAWIGDQHRDVDIDVSFGLRLEPPPQSLLYQPRMGEAFTVNKSVATELQMAWKLHQCMVRPRFKDMMDIVLVLRANTVDAAVIRAVLEEECRRDKTPMERFNWLLDQTIVLHPAWERIKCGRYSMADCFEEWRASTSPFPGLHLAEDRLEHVYCGGAELLWPDLGRLVAELSTLLKGAGFAPVAAPAYAPSAEPVGMSVRLARAAPLNAPAPDARIALAEGFLRRVAIIDGPFMLEGSYVTRQRIHEGWRRIPNGLDWVGLGPPDAALLTTWLTAIADIALDDGVRFRGFSDDPLRCHIDTAFAGDFPAAKIDLAGWTGAQRVEHCHLNVRFGVQPGLAPQPMPYRPQSGAPFMLPNCVAAELQIAWKLHRCLTRPSFKDMLDLSLLIGDNSVDEKLVWAALENACGHGLALIRRFDWLLDQQVGLHPHWRGRGGAQACFSAWVGPGSGTGVPQSCEPGLDEVYKGRDQWWDYDDFIGDLANNLQRAGFKHVPASVIGLGGLRG